MNIGIIGLGLIGGSICKAIKANTDHRVLGHDIEPAVAQQAADAGSIDEVLDPDGMDRADLFFICLHPDQTIAFIRDHAGAFRRGAIICDVCGVKRRPVGESESLLSESGVYYLGTHPMAGREFSGFAYSDAAIFKGASFILTPTERTPAAVLETVSELARAMGFGMIVSTSPDQHDRNIAFTSQLAHIASNAYVKSPSLERQRGFSAGSFQDLTRVAKLNEDLWTELFLMNRDYLLDELDLYISHLNEYEDALRRADAGRLRELLREGRELKEKSLMDERSVT